MTFKVGDKVKTQGVYSFGRQEGEIVDITGIKGIETRYDVYLANLPGIYTQRTWPFFASELQLIEEEKK